MDAGVRHRSPAVIPIELAGRVARPLPRGAEPVSAAISAAVPVDSHPRAELTTVMRGILGDGSAAP